MRLIATWTLGDFDDLTSVSPSLRSKLGIAVSTAVPKPLSYCHRPITEDDLVFIRRLIAEHPGLSRRRLSTKLCEAWNWVQPNGALRDMVCRGMISMLHRVGLIELPAVRFVPRNPMVERSAPSLVDVDQTALHTSLAELGPLEIRQVRRTPEEALFNSLLQQHIWAAATAFVSALLTLLPGSTPRARKYPG